MNTADTKGASAKAFDSLAIGLGEIAATRQRLRAEFPNSPMPDDIRQMVVRTRRMLRRAGLPQHVIDATPGLERPDWMGR